MPRNSYASVLNILKHNMELSHLNSSRFYINCPFHQFQYIIRYKVDLYLNSNLNSGKRFLHEKSIYLKLRDLSHERRKALILRGLTIEGSVL